jgi:hypothetical protein
MSEDDPNTRAYQVILVNESDDLWKDVFPFIISAWNLITKLTFSLLRGIVCHSRVRPILSS